MLEDENNRKVGSSTIGLQEDKQTWILSSTVYLNSVGALLQKSESKYVWLSHIAMQNAGNSSDINCASLSPHIHFPLSTTYVKPLLLSIKKCFKHNFIPAVMSLASSVMCLHYESILEFYEGHTYMAQVKLERLKHVRQHWHLWACTRKVSTKRIPPRSGFLIDVPFHPCHSV